MPPGPYGTTILTGRVGQSCACAAPTRRPSIAAAIMIVARTIPLACFIAHARSLELRLTTANARPSRRSRLKVRQDETALSPEYHIVHREWSRVGQWRPRSVDIPPPVGQHASNLVREGPASKRRKYVRTGPRCVCAAPWPRSALPVSRVLTGRRRSSAAADFGCVWIVPYRSAWHLATRCCATRGASQHFSQFVGSGGAHWLRRRPRL